jgi:hypothetical protein
MVKNASKLSRVIFDQIACERSVPGGHNKSSIITRELYWRPQKGFEIHHLLDALMDARRVVSVMAREGIWVREGIWAREGILGFVFASHHLSSRIVNLSSFEHRSVLFSPTHFNSDRQVDKHGKSVNCMTYSIVTCSLLGDRKLHLTFHGCL